jgi:2-amino-4-hydroxy-6-hydroxymethyldihydropteridine diphosphokinase
MENKIFLGLGSNLGERLINLKNAVEKINELNSCNVVSSSSVYESSPYGNIEQPNFYNSVIEIESGLSHQELHKNIKEIEIELGREATENKWAPRIIDIDILFYNQLIYKEDYLIIPHPEILKRDFVIVPLVEIDCEFIHPVVDIRLSEIDMTNIKKYILNKLNYKLK